MQQRKKASTLSESCQLARFIHIQISLCRWLRGRRRRRRGEYYLYTMTRRRPHDQIIQTQTVPGWAVIFVLHEPSNLLGLEYLTRSRTSMYSFLAWLLAHKQKAVYNVSWICREGTAKTVNCCTYSYFVWLSLVKFCFFILFFAITFCGEIKLCKYVSD